MHDRIASSICRASLCGLLSSFALLACQDPEEAPPIMPTSWHVDGGFLRAPDGRAAILRGTNVSGQQKNAPYLDANTAEDYGKLRTLFGMNAIRFVMTWAAVEPMRGQYDDVYLDAVAQRMKWAEAAGLLVILDMHEDIFGEGFGFDGAPRWACDDAYYQAFMPREPWFLNSVEPNVQACVDKFFSDADTQAHFIGAWQHVAERLAGATPIIGFDVLNEPNWGTYSLYDFEQDRLTPLYTQVVNAVRKAAPNWVAFLEPAATRNLGIPTGLAAFPFANVVYAPHSYDANAEEGGGFDPAHRSVIFDNIAALAEEATALNASLWIGEYGGVTTTAGYGDYMRAQYDGAGAVAGSTMYYDDSRGGGYSMLDLDGTPRQAALDALIMPYPEYVAGTPHSYAFDAPSGVFRFAYRSSASGVTDAYVPDRLFKNGYQVQCGGCRFEKSADHLRITSAPPDTEIAAVISPTP